MAERFSLKDHLFNADTVAQLGREYAAGIPEFDPSRFEAEALSGFPDRELMARLEWLADCVEQQLSSDFPVMAAQLTAAMPEPLSLENTDDDFGHFIHAVPGILAVRHGLEHHRERSMQLLHEATQRFSMEFYVRAFLNRWPEETLQALAEWSGDTNYHVRRLVSEGTRPKLPWAKAVNLAPEQTLSLLDTLHADPTRYVTRSVSNHLNDLSKTSPDLVLGRLTAWREEQRQNAKELSWMTRHSLRTLVKAGHSGAMETLGYRADAPVTAVIELAHSKVAIGDSLQFACSLSSDQKCPVLIDYRITFARPEGRSGSKVFKLKQAQVDPSRPLELKKAHKLKADATTFVWYPGPHKLTLQVNGTDRAAVDFEVV